MTVHLANVVEVIGDRGAASAERWSVGSGYLIDERTVLTAAHVVEGAVAVSVRSMGTTEHDVGVLLTTPPDIDLALLEVEAGLPVGHRPAFGVVDRETPGRVAGIRAIGFPRFKEAVRRGRKVRDSAQVDGYIPTAEGMVSGYLTLHADSRPREIGGALPESAWAGMSGAAVFAGGVLVGIVSEHHLAEGDASLTVAPLDRIRRAEEATRLRFWRLLGIDDPSELVTLKPTEADPGRKPKTAARLPVPRSDFTGREEDLRRAVGLLDQRRAVVVWGQPGVGKSELAAQAAHRLSTTYPDGSCHIDLQGYSDNRTSAEQAAARILETLAPDQGVPGDAAARYAACREAIRSGRHVIVLDNAGSAAQVRELLPGPCDSAVFVTSRSSLPTLDAEFVELDVLDTASAVALIRKMTERAEDADLLELVRLCGRLPLALRIAGALLRSRPQWSVGRLNVRLADENRRLALLERDDLAVRPVFESSRDVLGPEARRLFALLGSVAAIRIAPWMAAALLDADLFDAEELLEELVDAQLLRAAGTDAGGTLRYVFHDLVRLYAKELLRSDVPAAERAAAEERMLSGYLSLALLYSSGHPITGNFDFARTVPQIWSVPVEHLTLPPDAMDWLVEERADLVAEVKHAYAERHLRYVWGLADILHAVFILSHHGPESQEVKDLALSAAQLAGDEEAELETRFHLNSLLHFEGRYAEAVEELARQRAARSARGEARWVCHLDLITGVVQRDGGMLHAAHRSLTRSIEEFAALPDRDGPLPTLLTASAQQNLAVVLRDLGRLREADDLLTQCLATFERMEDATALGRGLHTRGILHLYLGRYDEAEVVLGRSVELMRAAGDRKWIAIVLLAQARLAIRRSAWEPAFALLEQCDDLFRAIADPAGRAQVLRSRAVALRCLGQLDEADTLFAAAHEALKAVKDRRSHARLHYSMALAALARRDRYAAFDQLDKASALFTQEDDPVWTCRLSVLRGRASPGDCTVGLRAQIEAFAERAGEGYTPLWIHEARRRLVTE
ncbi:trypsin-like peptidase domain-containing protein [Streptomyces sp. NPDC016309]|uniref:trypsin-like peptidase domain-containing protein n=1 Tax=Streptomyces sp. NPDC016309 TaxID=3364965 RepID=UPI0036FB7D3E